MSSAIVPKDIRYCAQTPRAIALKFIYFQKGRTPDLLQKSTTSLKLTQRPTH